MNFIDKILQSSKTTSLPQFAQQPVQQAKPTMTLFSDEQSMFQKMKADNLPDEQAYAMLKKRRADIMGNTDIDGTEREILQKMQADNVPVKQAVAMIQKRRTDNFNKKYEEANLLQKGAYNTLAFAAGNLETIAKYGGNTLDFITGGTAGFGDEVKKMQQVTQSPEFSQSTAFKAGGYAPDVALAVSPLGGGFISGAKTATNLALRSGLVGAGFGAAQPILDKGSDVTAMDIGEGALVGGTIGAVVSPVLSKTIKYGRAGYYGGFEGAGKSIARDIRGGVNAITPSGANISTKANRFNAQEIRDFTKMTGQSPGDFATSRGMTKVGDDAVLEATNLWQKSKEQADEALKAIKGRFKVQGEDDVLKTTLDDLDGRLTRTRSPDANRLRKLKTKYEDSGLTMSEINEVKRLYSKNYKYTWVDAGSEPAITSRNLQDQLREWQFKVAEENGLTNLEDINKTTQGWKMFADSLSKKIQGSSGNNNVSLTDWIALSGGGPENIALYLGKKLGSSDKVKQGAIKLFSKKTKPSIIEASMGDIQNANFLKNVNRGVSGAGNNSGGKSLVRPVGLLEAPKGQATGAKNFRVNQPTEKAPIVNEGQKGARPITPKAKEAQKLLPAPRVPAGTTLPRTDIVAESMRNTNSKRPTAKPLKKSPSTTATETKKSVVVPEKKANAPIEEKSTIKAKTLKSSEKPVTNITRNEQIEQGFSNSAKARWDKGDFTREEIGKATSYLKSNYKGKEYTIDGKKYKVDAIDNRNEQVRLVDSEGNIIRVKTNKLPETKVSKEDIFDYYNSRVQKGYKTVLKEPIKSEGVKTPKKLTPVKK